MMFHDVDYLDVDIYSTGGLESEIQMCYYL